MLAILAEAGQRVTDVLQLPTTLVEALHATLICRRIQRQKAMHLASKPAERPPDASFEEQFRAAWTGAAPQPPKEVPPHV